MRSSRSVGFFTGLRKCIPIEALSRFLTSSGFPLLVAVSNFWTSNPESGFPDFTSLCRRTASLAAMSYCRASVCDRSSSENRTRLASGCCTGERFGLEFSASELANSLALFFWTSCSILFCSFRFNTSRRSMGALAACLSAYSGFFCCSCRSGSA